MRCRCIVWLLWMLALQTGCEASGTDERRTGDAGPSQQDPDSGLTADDSDTFDFDAGSAPEPTCTPEELAAACEGVQCGLSVACEMNCGACAEGEMCMEGTCTTPEALCEEQPETCECLSLDLSIPTRQSCSISLTGDPIDGEGFIEADGGTHRVLAINRWGEGHLMAWCDASTSSQLLASFAALPYLGRKAMPTFASFGNEAMCDGDFGVQSFEDNPVYLGADLPDRYLGDPALLAADWDVLMLCGAYTSWHPDWPALLQSYVTEHGKGLYVVMDYQGWDHTVDDFTELNRVLAPSGIALDPVDLSWGDASVEVGVECLPDLTEAVLQ